MKLEYKALALSLSLFVDVIIHKIVASGFMPDGISRQVRGPGEHKKERG
ncbi:MAG: hypothetical protein MUP17_11950 [candidate division Zixibacteria bacterium]|nr:hypothetical protein [candidate division Zixibacteria bacterium]